MENSYCFGKSRLFLDQMRSPDSIWYRALFSLIVATLLGSCESYGPFHPNTATEPLNSIRGPSDGRYKFAFIEFGDQGSALDYITTSGCDQRDSPGTTPSSFV
jgi:hypothetical protein